MQQLGAPRELYDHPVNLFVATFMGASPLNLLSGVLRSTRLGIEIVLPSARVDLPPELAQEKSELPAYLNREIIVEVRPEAALLTDGTEGELAGVVAFQEDLGANMVTTVELAARARLDGAVVEDIAEWSGVPRVSNRLRVIAHGGTRVASTNPSASSSISNGCISSIRSASSPFIDGSS